MKILESKNGYYIKQVDNNIKNIIIGKKIYLSSAESINNWKQISQEDGDKIIYIKDNLGKIKSLNDIDDILCCAENINSIINDIYMTDNDALKHKLLYPVWDDFIDKKLNKDFKILYDNKLYKVKQDHIVQKQFPPSIETSSLYEEINEKHAGTINDPIPYNGNMILIHDLYYTQDEKLYKCIIDTGNPVYEHLDKMVQYGYVEYITK